MADAPTIHLDGNSPEEVAYKLMWDILRNEDHAQLSRDMFLSTYVEARRAVQGVLASKR